MKPLKTILYAEDDVVTLTAYKNRLERAGYIVRTANDGVEAVRSLHQSPPDLLLLDLMLPKFTGEDVLKFLSSHPALDRIPVIVLSTNSILTTSNEGLLENAERHFLKHNCRFPVLLEAIQELLAEAPATVRANRHAKANAPTLKTASAPAADPLLNQIKELQDHTPVVCAWTDRINIEGKWLKLTEFLSERLQVQVSHGISPEAAQQFSSGK